MRNFSLVGFGTVGKTTFRSFLNNQIYINTIVSRRIKKNDIIYIRCHIPTNQKILTLSKTHVYGNHIIDLSGDKNISFTTPFIHQSHSLISANKQFLSSALSNVNFHHNNHHIRYDASVGGCVPIVTTLRSISFFKLISARLVINGTTNYILSMLSSGSGSARDILLRSIKKGYAEKNISYDLMGYDIKHKIDILLKTIGIRSADIVPEKLILDKTFFQFFSCIGFSIKYFSVIRLLSGSVEIIIAGCIIRDISQYTTGIYNYIETKIKNIGKLLFFGLGAGAKPTSLSIISDVLNAPGLSKTIVFHHSIGNIIRFVGILFYHHTFLSSHLLDTSLLLQSLMRKMYVYNNNLFFLTNRISNGRFFYIRKLFLSKNILSIRML